MDSSLATSGQASLHFGWVVEVDTSRGLAQVHVEDLGLTTGWLKLPVPRASKDHAVDWIDVGDFVSLVADERLVTGVVLAAHYTAKNPPPQVGLDRVYREFSDGSVIEFDRSTGVLRLDIKSRIEITVSGGLHIENDAESTINGKPILVIGSRDNDTEGNGPDVSVSSGQG